MPNWWDSVSDETKNDLRRRYCCGELSLPQIVDFLKAQGIETNYQRMRWLVRNNPEQWKREVPVEKVVDVDRLKLLERHEEADLKRKYTEALEGLNMQEKLLEALHNAVHALPPIEFYPYDLPEYPFPSLLEAMAPLADQHVGEVVLSSEMSGLAEYNIDIFNKRMFHWTDRILLLTDIRRKADEIRRIYVPQLGDSVSGDIHFELAKTNVDTAMMMTVTSAFVNAQALIRLASHFDEVIVDGVPGNHGRQTQKVEYKRMSHMNWDYLNYQLQAMFCKEQKNINFRLDDCFFKIIEVAGKRILMWHGGDIRSYYNTPIYGINTAVARFREVLQAADRYFDEVLLAHFHSGVEIAKPTGSIYVSGPMCGGNEFALARMHTMSQPTHMLLLYHEDVGCASKETIYLRKADTMDVGFRLPVPGVWANAELVNA